MVFCRGCGKEIHESALSCPHCGAPQSIAQDGKNKTTAILLALFLGGLGAQHFYLGRTLAAVLSVLFFWTLIPALVSFVDLILLILMPESKFNEKFNK